MAFTLILFTSYSYSSLITKHTDGRIKGMFDPLSFKALGVEQGTLSEKDLINKILKGIAKTYKIKIPIKKLKLTNKVNSLRGTHYTFQEFKKDQAIRGSYFNVSINKLTSKLISFFNNINQVKVSNEEHTISIDRVTELAWEKSKFRGSLMQEPTVKKQYKEHNSQVIPVYEVSFMVEKPSGNWTVTIDAQSGKVLSTTDLHTYRKNYEYNSSLLEKKSFADELSRVRFKKFTSQGLLAKNSTEETVDGSGFIFKPNPVTTLMRDDLQDNMPSKVFENAYFLAELKGITLKDGVYHLKGENIELLDFESPKEAPVTSETGHWDSKRGNLGFNDVMTYHHLDSSMRYLKSLGYDQEKNIFPEGLGVDANAVDGADNSYFSPRNNVLAFGHGCVDDNEDSDVILHELGHAIQHNIIGDSFFGGDSGAIGEGFGDYWAASYSYMQENGSYKDNWVFKWDGHNNCWDGRIVDAMDLEYDHSKNYRAHSRIGDRVTDELWSTPIYQAFKEMVDNAIADYDQIQSVIIESHYGLGSNIKMRDLATSTVATATDLYPDSQIAEVYEKHFKRHKILK